MKKNNIETLEIFAINYLKNLDDTIYSEEIIKDAVHMFSSFVKGISEKEIEQTIVNLETRFNITMEQGAILKGTDNYKKWYYSSKSENGTSYWNRYRRYLEEEVRTPSQVIDQIDYAADEIMDNLANPKSDANFSRKGLVIGAVQSGKTSNYIGLMNKAADSGYKVIIVLTGTIEKLRKQTQERIDEGFIGSDSKAILDNNKSRSVGVGNFEYLDGETLTVAPFTTTSDDFNIKANLKIEGHKGPAVFVLKKNKSVLEKLAKWLKIYNVNEMTGTIESPLLLIDDEADNASVNTSSEDKDPTTINQLIRNILKLFSKSSYVGFTATPFANIFIDPQYKSDEGDDLFPRDFIYLLEQPSNYVGPTELYSSEGKYNYMLRNNDDVENVLKIKHKNGEFPSRLPDTLKEAIIVFFLSNAIRDIRGDGKKHRSMLIHISRFISVQNNIRDKVDSYVKYLQLQIQNYIYDDVENETISEIHRIFDKEFGSNEVDGFKKEKISEEWLDVKDTLLKSVIPIQVKVVNSGVASKNLNYDEYEDGLRLIAIGGLSLARGLTLEGLMTSYFYRNTKMYDTLMQMGRWFGYRDGYADLCRLWTSSESAAWYEHIAIATEELRYEIKKMDSQNKKPIEFGLKVRSAEDAPLIITAKNKMRSADQMSLRRTLNGQVVETPILYKNSDKLKENNLTIQEWLKDNQNYNCSDFSNLKLKKPTLKNVSKQNIVRLLNDIDIPYMNDITSIIKIIEKNDSDLFEKWDVVLATTDNPKIPEKDKVQFGPYKINPMERSFDFFGSTGDFIRMSKSKKRLGVVGYVRGGLTKRQFEEIDKEVKKQRENLGRTKNGGLKSPSEYMYFNTGKNRNPLIIIYPIKLKPDEDSRTKDFVENNSELVTGISIGIPDIDGSDSVTYEYAINVALQRELLGIPINVDEDEDEEDYNAY